MDAFIGPPAMMPAHAAPPSEDAILDFFARQATALRAEFAAKFGALPPPASPKPARPIPPAPELSTLPRITSGTRRGERWMTKAQFAGWCTVTVATVSDWIYTRRIQTKKQGSKKQSRVLIASGERERLLPPVIGRKRKKTHP